MLSYYVLWHYLYTFIIVEPIINLSEFDLKNDNQYAIRQKLVFIVMIECSNEFVLN